MISGIVFITLSTISLILVMTNTLVLTIAGITLGGLSLILSLVEKNLIVRVSTIIISTVAIMIGTFWLIF